MLVHIVLSTKKIRYFKMTNALSLKQIMIFQPFNLIITFVLIKNLINFTIHVTIYAFIPKICYTYVKAYLYLGR